MLRSIWKFISISNNNYTKHLSRQFCSINLETMYRHHVEDIVQKLNEFAREDLAEKWDNVGLLIEPHTPRTIKKIILTNDLTEDVLKEAVETNCEFILSYHPPIFQGLKKISQKTWKERIVSICLENRIAVYSPHTAWDSVQGGVNDWLARSMPISESKPIAENANYPNCGAGRLCILHKELSLSEIIKLVKEHIDLDCVQHSIAVGKTLNSAIKTVAICAGSGASLLKGVQADLYLTGEMSHHEVLDAIHNDVHVILCNHSNSERGFLKEFKPILEKLLNNEVEIVVSEMDADPLTPNY